MLGTIVAKEFLSNILTFRFSIGFLVCLLLIVASSYVLTQDYADRLESYRTAIREYEEEMSKIKVYSELCGDHKPKAFRKPKPLSVFNQGVDKRLGNVVEASVGTVPMRAKEYSPANPYMSVFPSVDLALVFQVVLSLLALLFAYDAISGEREDGTLCLMLSNDVPRDTVLLGKYLGGMVSLLLPLMVSLLGGLLVMQLSPGISLKGADWARIGLIFLVSLLYLSLFYLLGLLLSIRTHRSSTALMFAMFLWVTLVLIFPSATVFLVDKLAPIRSEETVASATSEIWKEFNSKSDEFLKKLGLKSPFEMANAGSTVSSRSDSFTWGETVKAYGFRSEEGVRLAQEFYGFKCRLAVEYADKVWQVYRKYLDENPIRQARLALNISRISPAAAYYNATAVLSETDLGNFLNFMAQARMYRDQIVQYLTDKKAFSSRQWFADDKGVADITDLPRFSERREGIGDSLKRAGVDILLLVILNFLLFLGGYASFLRCDVR
ncbi:ABC transporter permease subunit [Candidatus Poribacteria bacterium]|nr:ABC transporter permease subunit [Candidatus Poribacteria bacterium]